MDEIMAYCGLACQECGAFLAIMENDDQKRVLDEIKKKRSGKK